MLEKGQITHHDGGTMMVGPKAVNVFRLITIQAGLKMLHRTNGRMLITRTATPTALFRLASEVTGAKYKRGQYEKAIAELQITIDLRRSEECVEVDERSRA